MQTRVKTLLIFIKRPALLASGMSITLVMNYTIRYNQVVITIWGMFYEISAGKRTSDDF